MSRTRKRSFRSSSNSSNSMPSPTKKLRSGTRYSVTYQPPSGKFPTKNRTNTKKFTGKYDNYCIQLPQGGFIKLSSDFKDELEQLYDIYYEFPKNKLKSLPNGQYFFVLNKSSKTKYRLGIIEVNPSEYYTYHYTLVTIMAIKNKNNQIEPFIIAGELVKYNNTITWSDFSGTYKDFNYDAIMDHALTKYSLAKKTPNIDKYIKYINSEINPVMETLLGEPCNFESFKELIDAGDQATMSNYLKSCTRINHNKLIFFNKDDCSKNNKSLGNICDLDKFYLKYNQEMKTRRARIIDAIHIPIFKKAVHNYKELSNDELKILKELMPNKKIVFSRMKHFIPKLIQVYLDELNINLEEY